MWGHVLQTLLDKFVRLHGQVEIWKGKKKNYFTFPWVSDFKNNSSCSAKYT